MQGQCGLTSCGQRTTLPLSEHDERTRVLHSGAVRKFILLLTLLLGPYNKPLKGKIKGIQVYQTISGLTVATATL